MKNYIYLIAPVIGWLAAQGIKFILTLRKDGISWADALQSGGMPSSHTSFMVAISTVIGINLGVGSVEFAIIIAITAIIIYDAVGVRKATGEQTTAIRELAKHDNKKLSTYISNAKGHSLSEVVVGGLVGLLVGLLTNIVIG
ncbi:MAG: divergent PAP2 family protein [Candidatus Saccharibacteria bacterium]